MTGSPRPFTRWIQRYDWRLLSFCFCLPAHPTCRLQWPKLIIGLSPMFFFVQGDQVLGGLVKVSQSHDGQTCYAFSCSTKTPFRLNPRRSSHPRSQDHMIALWPSRARDASD